MTWKISNIVNFKKILSANLKPTGYHIEFNRKTKTLFSWIRFFPIGWHKEWVHHIDANLQICPIIVGGATVPQLCQCSSDTVTVATSLISWYIRNKVTGMEWCQRINVSPFENKLLSFTSLCSLFFFPFPLPLFTRPPINPLVSPGI